MLRVIIADDEPKVANLIVHLVDWDALDMDVVAVAKDGDEALEFIMDLSPDIVITDIRMPGLTGIEMIAAAKKIVPNLDFIIISGFKHFEYAHTAIKYGVVDYLLKPIDQAELNSTLLRMKEAHEQNTKLLSDMDRMIKASEDATKMNRQKLFDYLVDRSALEQDQKKIQTAIFTESYMNEQLNYHFAEDAYLIVAIKIDARYDDIHSGVIDTFESRAYEVIDTGLRRLCIDLNYTYYKSKILIVLNYEKSAGNLVRSMLKDVYSEIKIQNRLLQSAIFTMVAGPEVSELESLVESYQTVRFHVQQRLIDGNGRFIDLIHEKRYAEERSTERSAKCNADHLPTGKQAPNKQVSDNQTASSHAMGLNTVIAELINGLETCMELMDSEQMQTLLNQSATSVLKLDHLLGRDVVQYVHSIVDNYLLMLQRHSPLQMDITSSKRNIEAHIEVIGSASEVLDYANGWILKSYKEMLEAIDDEGHRPIIHAKQYIREHFAEPIKLDDIASMEGFNASYFSVLFHNETSETFSSYLQSIRIDEAKRLLRETNLSVAKICENVGYSDVKNFTAMFKKSAGVKPGEFRKLYSWGRK
ncbi:MAG: response regulator [Clostridiales Family XIII bacterium]|jgi:two-component system response regulator YesN|nr:response regulator [Clostridiales Family XIII bacterium]